MLRCLSDNSVQRTPFSLNYEDMLNESVVAAEEKNAFTGAIDFPRRRSTCDFKEEATLTSGRPAGRWGVNEALSGQTSRGVGKHS